MRRWLALFAGVAAVAVAGTALALAGSVETATQTTLGEKSVTGEIETPAVEESKETERVEKIEVDRPIREDHRKEVTRREPVVDTTDETPPPKDETPPHIEILYPEDGQVFGQSEVVFEGTTEPGSSVFAGKWEADVGEDGAWRIVLYLSPGENLATLKALDSAGNQATDTVKVIYEAPKKEVADQPKEESKEKPVEEKKEEPREDHESKWGFEAHQVYGECAEDPSYDVFYGRGKPGSTITIRSEFGSKSTGVGDHGEWEAKVVFESAPVGKAFPVKVKDEFGNHTVFEFIKTG